MGCMYFACRLCDRVVVSGSVKPRSKRSVADCIQQENRWPGFCIQSCRYSMDVRCRIASSANFSMSARYCLVVNHQFGCVAASFAMDISTIDYQCRSRRVPASGRCDAGSFMSFSFGVASVESVLKHPNVSIECASEVTIYVT